MNYPLEGATMYIMDQILEQLRLLQRAAKKSREIYQKQLDLSSTKRIITHRGDVRTRGELASSFERYTIVS